MIESAPNQDEPVVADLPNTPLLDDETPFATMMASFDDAARRLGLDEAEYRVLRQSDREVAVSIPVHLDDGNVCGAGRGAEKWIVEPRDLKPGLHIFRQTS